MHSEDDVAEMRRAVADATATLPIADVRRLDVRPGDTLVVRVPRNQLTVQSAHEMEVVAGSFGDDVKVVFMPDDCDVEIVRGAAGEDDV